LSASVFVQIPAYRDRELLPTLRDLFATARDPARLRVVVAWQYGDDELHLESELRRWKNLSLLKIPARESQGCNWARSLLQGEWNAEPYTLFLDSHHRFVPEWDEIAIAMHEDLRAAGIAKPILTGYLPPYDPGSDPQGREATLYRIRLAERRHGLIFRLVGDAVTGLRDPPGPFAAHFASLHFLFADGSFNREIPFDSSIYFFADEAAIALRAYTHGYDLHHPHRVLGWHLYERATRVTHWADHADWQRLDRISSKRLHALYSGRLSGKFGVGRHRSVADYEAFVGMPLIERS
jgi:hypothetical protein